MPAALQLSVHIEEWPTQHPFRITGHTWNSYRVNVVELTDGVHVGRGESTPVHNLHETADSVYAQIEAATADIVRGIHRQALLESMPPGSARNAVDCALWDLEAKRSARSIWELTGITPRPVATSFTVGIEDTPQEMAARAAAASTYPTLKIKLNADRPVERVAAVRAARPDARLTVDANQGWSFAELQAYAPGLHALGVELIEQPLPRGADASLEGYAAPVPLCADESCQHRGELEQAARRYQVINVKLDKAGGLTEALLLGRAVRQSGRQLLVSCMGGTSLGMAPGFVLAQMSDYVELDGHTLLKRDRLNGLRYQDGKLVIPESRLWG
jgi:L-alanine-DL-glutamate epimerase-like enolase superfamily enzyme